MSSQTDPLRSLLLRDFDEYTEARLKNIHHFQRFHFYSDPGKNGAPVIVAAGTGPVAQNILNVAAENGIAIYHDDSAATLLSKLELGQEVPPALYQIVVSIYLSLLDLAEEKKN